MAGADPLVRTLTEIVVELTAVLADVVGEHGGPRPALSTLEWVAYVLADLEPDQQQRLVETVAGIAESADPDRREFMESFADDFGLGKDIEGQE